MTFSFSRTQKKVRVLIVDDLLALEPVIDAIGQSNASQAKAGLNAMLEQGDQLDAALEDYATRKRDQAKAAVAENTATFESVRWLQIGLIGGAIVVGLALAFFMARGISNAARQMVLVARGIAQGELDHTITLKSKGEMGDMAGSFQQMIVNLNEMIGQTNNITNQVVQSVGQVRAVGQDLAASAEEQSAAAEEVTSNLEETEAQIKSNADNANLANSLVGETADTAAAGQTKMKAMTGAMTAIAQSSQEIGKIIKVIDEIAFQTNLLALNAAVEAARAGQHGRGFAVIAQEVRTLAGRSAKAAKETAELIEGPARRVQEGVSITEEMALALGDIVQKVAKVRDLVAEINVASEEQAKGITQINGAMIQVSQGAQANSQQSEELASTADELGNLADRLREEMSRFRLKQQSTYRYEGPESKSELASLNGQHKYGPKNVAPVKAGRSNGKGALILDRDERGYEQF